MNNSELKIRFSVWNEKQIVLFDSLDESFSDNIKFHDNYTIAEVGELLIVKGKELVIKKISVAHSGKAIQTIVTVQS